MANIKDMEKELTIKQEEKTEKTTSKRLVYADLLKILASIAVVLVHVISTRWYALSPKTFDWKFINFFNAASRWCVPIFIMVTGMLLLKPEKKITIGQIFKKYILKILILLISWSVIFAFLDQITSKDPFTLQVFLDRLIPGHYHLWYLYMLIGLYIVTPLIKPLITKDNKKIIEYFLILWFIFQMVLAIAIKFPELKKLDTLVNRLNMNLVMGYVGFYILGYYLNTYKLDKAKRIILYILGIAGIIFAATCTDYNINNRYQYRDMFYDYLSTPVCLTGAALFVFGKEVFSKIKFTDKSKNIISKLTKLSLGVYLIHPIFLILMEKYNINLMMFDIRISLFIFTACIYLLSLLLSFILSKIPILNKYIV